MQILDLYENRDRATPFSRDAQGTWTFDPYSFDIIRSGLLRVTVRQRQRASGRRPAAVVQKTLVLDRSSQTWTTPAGSIQTVDEQGFPQGPARSLADNQARPWSSSRLVQDLVNKLVSQRYIERAV